jgi:hypothetical protein
MSRSKMLLAGALLIAAVLSLPTGVRAEPPTPAPLATSGPPATAKPRMETMTSSASHTETAVLPAPSPDASPTTVVAPGADPSPAAVVAPGADASPAAAVVARDRATGQLRAATPAEVKALHAQARLTSTESMKTDSPVVRRANGSAHKHLGEAGLVYAIAVRDAAGKLGMHCVGDEQAAAAALTPSVSTLRHEERRHEDR